MELMRHSDMKLTAKTYTDAGLLPTGDAISQSPIPAEQRGQVHTGEHTRFSLKRAFAVIGCHASEKCR
jgi:hypothetical protein